MFYHMRSFILTFLACISICINAQEQYGIAINDSDKMVMTPCTIVDTASVMTKVNNYMIPFFSLRDYVGKKTDNKELLQYAMQLGDKYPGYPYERNSIVRSAQKGKIDSSLKDYINATIAKYNEFINYTNHDNGVEIEKWTFGLCQFNTNDWEGAKSLGVDTIPYSTKMVMYENPYYRPKCGDKDYIDVNNQNIDAAWIFTEEGKAKSQSYPIEMDYISYLSHPDLIISGNAIYDKEYNLKRIIVLKRKEVGSYALGKFRPNENNGIYYINDELGNAIRNCFYVSDYNSNKYSIQKNISSNTKYAIENLVGIRQETVQIQKDAQIYDAVNFVRKNQSILNRMTAKEKADVNKEWARLSNFPEKYNTHKTKMNDQTAHQWYKQVQSDHRDDLYEYYKIERVDDLHFRVIVTNEEYKPTLEVVIEFYQESTQKNRLAYSWRVTDYKVKK